MSNATFTCKRCGYSSIYKQALMKHLEKKKVCTAIIEDISVEDLLDDIRPSVKSKQHQCAQCKKGFTHLSGLSRHKKSCTGNNEKNVTQEMNSTQLERDLLKEELRKEILAELQAIQPNLSVEQKTNITGNNNVTVNNNNNTYVVVVNNFGSEDVSHVLQDQKFLDDCLKTLQTGIPNVVNKIYYDESKPENKTVLLKSVKRKTAMVHTDGKWEEKDLNQVVPIMVRKGSRILSKHLIAKDVPADDIESHEITDAKHGYISSVVTQKKPEYDIVSSAVKASICNHRHSSSEE